MAASAELHLQPAAIACIVLAVTALFWWGIHCLSFLFERWPVERELFGAIGTAGAAPAGSASRSQLPHFIVLCFAMGAVLHAEPLVDTAAELHLHEGVVVCVVLSVAALFNWAILSVNFLVARRPAEGEPKVVLSPTSSAAAAPTGSASRPQLPHFAVLCVTMGTALHAEPLIAAAADLNIHHGVVALVVFSVAAFFHRAILSFNILVAPRPPKREGKILLRQADPAASTAGSHHLARSAFLILAALTSASWFVEPFAAAAEFGLPRALAIASVVFVASLFNGSIHLFRSFFLPRAPTAAAAAASWEGVGAIAVAAVGMGVATCLVAAGGAAYGDAPARG